MGHINFQLAGAPWHAAVEEAASLASRSAENEAEGAARDVAKHVYILAGYAEPLNSCSLGTGEISARAKKSHGTEDAAAICKARAMQDNANVASGSGAPNKQPIRSRYVAAKCSISTAGIRLLVTAKQALVVQNRHYKMEIRLQVDICRVEISKVCIMRSPDYGHRRTETMIAPALSC